MSSKLPYYFIILTLLSSAAAAQTNLGRSARNFAENNGERAAAVEDCGPVGQAEPARSITSAISELEQKAFDLINTERAAKGLPALVWSDRVANLARGHSQNMAKNGYFSHQDLDGQLVDDRAEKIGLADWTAIGENIAFVKGFRDPAGFAVEQWMRSNSHRENLLSARWTESAIGVEVTSDGICYFTQVFMVRKQ